MMAIALGVVKHNLPISIYGGQSHRGWGASPAIMSWGQDRPTPGPAGHRGRHGRVTLGGGYAGRFPAAGARPSVSGKQIALPRRPGNQFVSHGKSPHGNEFVCPKLLSRLGLGKFIAFITKFVSRGKSPHGNECFRPKL